MIIDIIRTEEGLVQQRSTFLGGPIAFFSDVAQWSFVYKNLLYTLQTLVGDGVVVSSVLETLSLSLEPPMFSRFTDVTWSGSPGTSLSSHV
jgi:hypothetical protein